VFTGVIELEKNKDGEDVAKVVNPRLDTMSREVFRHDDLRDLVRLERERNHFLCEWPFDHVK
jgi:DNA-directed RNA polymerase I and III subunit RPAC1